MLIAEMWRVTSVANFIHPTQYKGVYNGNMNRSNVPTTYPRNNESLKHSCIGTMWLFPNC